MVSNGLGGKPTTDTIAASVKTLTARDRISPGGKPRAWGMLITVTNDPTPANNTTWYLKYAQASTNINDNNNWVTAASAFGGGGGGSYTEGSILFAGPGGTISENNGIFFWDNTLNVLYVGANAGAFTNSKAHFEGSINSYSQINSVNKSAGASASTDFIVTADTGTDLINYGDFGINSSAYADAAFTISGPLDTYMYSNGGNLVLGTVTAARGIVFHTAGSLLANFAGRINSAGRVVFGYGATAQAFNPSNKVTIIGEGTGAVASLIIFTSNGITQRVSFTDNGVFTFTSAAPNGFVHNTNFTATANSNFATQETGTLTARATASDTLFGIRFANTLVAAAASQDLIAFDLAPTFTPGAFAPDQIAMRSQTGLILFGAATPTAGSVSLELGSTSLALLLNRTAADANITTKVDGMVWYNTTDNEYTGQNNAVVSKFHVDAKDAWNLGVATTATFIRTFTAVGSQVDIGISLVGKGSGAITLTSNGASGAIVINAGGVNLARFSGLTNSLDFNLSNAIVQGGASAAATPSGNLIIRTRDVGAGNNASSGDLYFQTGTPDGVGLHGNIAFFSTGPNFQAGQKIIYIANRIAAPTGNPAAGGFLFAEGGALRWRGSAGTVTTIAPA